MPKAHIIEPESYNWYKFHKIKRNHIQDCLVLKNRAPTLSVALGDKHESLVPKEDMATRDGFKVNNAISLRPNITFSEEYVVAIHS